VSSSDFNSVDYSIWGALHQLVYCRRRFRDIDHLKEVLQTYWQQIGQDVIDRVIGQIHKQLSLVVTSDGRHIEHCFD